MLLTRTAAAVLLFLLCSPSSLKAQMLPLADPKTVDVSPEGVRQLSKYMETLVDRGCFTGGITLMARRGRVVHFEAVGSADCSGTPMRKDAIFRIASMTKPVTSVAAMILCEKGIITLEDPVSKFIPEFKNPQVLVSVDPLMAKPAGQEITIRHLLSHQSGLIYAPFSPSLGPIYLENEINWDQHEIRRRFRHNSGRRLGRDVVAP